MRFVLVGTAPPSGRRRTCRCVAVSLCRCVAVSLCRCVAVSLCRCVAVSLCRCVAVSLCRCVAVSLCRCVQRSLRPTACQAFFHKKYIFSRSSQVITDNDTGNDTGRFLGGRSRGQEPRGFKIFKQKLHIGPLLSRWPMFTNLLLLAVTAPRKRAPSLKPLGSWPRWLQKSLLVLLLTGLPAATLHAAESARNPDAPSRRDVAIPFPFSFCDRYTFFRSAWHRPMNLYVSRNATNHQIAVARRAVQRWNMLFKRNVISFRGRHAYKIASRYTWRNHPKKDNDAFGFQANNDGASIIYFLPQYAVVRLPASMQAGMALLHLQHNIM